MSAAGIVARKPGEDESWMRSEVAAEKIAKDSLGLLMPALGRKLGIFLHGDPFNETVGRYEKVPTDEKVMTMDGFAETADSKGTCGTCRIYQEIASLANFDVQMEWSWNHSSACYGAPEAVMRRVYDEVERLLQGCLESSGAEAFVCEAVESNGSLSGKAVTYLVLFSAFRLKISAVATILHPEEGVARCDFKMFGHADSYIDDTVYNGGTGIEHDNTFMESILAHGPWHRMFTVKGMASKGRQEEGVEDIVERYKKDLEDKIEARRESARLNRQYPQRRVESTKMSRLASPGMMQLPRLELCKSFYYGL
jgi:hypothetical protein